MGLFVAIVFVLFQYKGFAFLEQKTIDSLETLRLRFEAEQRIDTAFVRVLNTLSRAIETKNPVQSMLYAARARSMATQLHDDEGLASALNNIAGIHWHQGRHDSALSYCFASLEVRERQKSERHKGRILNNIGLIYATQQRFDKALEYFYRAAEIARTLSDNHLQSSIFTNIGEAYSGRNTPDTAIIFHRKALVLYQELHWTEWIGVSLTNIGINFSKQRRYESATSYLRRGLAMIREAQNNDAMIEGLTYLADVYKFRGYADSARLCLDEALHLSQQFGFLQREHSVWLALCNLATSQNQYALALDHYRRAVALKDSLWGEKMQTKIIATETEYQAKQKEQQIFLLTKEMTFQTTVRNLFFIGLVIVLHFLGAMIWLYRSKKRSHRLLVEQSKIINDANIELQQNNDELENLNREKSLFLGIVAHDLKNPLTRIGLATGIMKRSYTTMAPDNVMKRLNDIELTVFHMREIVTNLLDSSALEDGEIRLSMQPLHVPTILHDIIDLYEDWAMMKHVRIVLQNSLEDNLFILADETKYYQIIENLLSNALKYSPRKTIVTIGATLLTINDGGLFVKISIKDQGPGLTDDDKHKLFQRFSRLSAQPTGNEQSTGLGLFTVKRLVESMNGTITCESITGAGATFSVIFPLVQTNINENKSAAVKNV